MNAIAACRVWSLAPTLFSLSLTQALSFLFAVCLSPLAPTLSHVSVAHIVASSSTRESRSVHTHLHRMAGAVCGVDVAKMLGVLVTMLVVLGSSGVDADACVPLPTSLLSQCQVCVYLLPRESSFPPSRCLCPAAEQPRVLTNERPLVFALVLVFVCLWFTLASALAQSHRARNVGVRARRHDARDARPTSGASRGPVLAGSLVAVMHIERRGVHVLASVPRVRLGCSSERLLRCVRHAVPCAVCLAWCARVLCWMCAFAREKDSTHRLRWYFGGRLGVGICWLSSRTMVRGRLGVGLEAVETEGPVWWLVPRFCYWSLSSLRVSGGRHKRWRGVMLDVVLDH